MARSSQEDRRNMQRWQSCHNFGTRAVWTSMQQDPTAAIETFTAHMSKLGLIIPSEPTSAWIASIVAAIMYGTATETMEQGKLQYLYDA